MTSPLPISVLLLARNESQALAALLPSLGFAAECVVVVDASTTDDTAAVAARAGARVSTRALDGFGAQRRHALAQCQQPWVLWIDADERLDAAAVEAIRAAVATGTANGYRLRRRTWFLGKPIRFCGWRNERVLRLFRREQAQFDERLVHEQVQVAGRIDDLEATLDHLSYESWDEARRKLLQYSAANAERLALEQRRASLLDVVARPPLRFVRMYLLQLGFLDGARGVVLCGLAACQVFLKYTGRWAAERGRVRPS
jgi:glycosyltransferase involved in cell wall biosynthesis